MNTNRATGYALLAVGYIAQHRDQKFITSQTIAKEHGLPQDSLTKLLLQLVRANVIRSKRGPRGGFYLAVPPKKITLLQVIEAIEGPMVGGIGLSESAKRKLSVKTKQTYEKALNQAKAVFQKTKISDLL